MAVHVEEFRQPAPVRRKAEERALEKIELPLQVDLSLELRNPRDEALIDGVDVLEGVAAPPVIADLVVDDLHQKPPGVRHVTEAPESRDGVQCDFLFEVFVAQRSARSFRGDTNHGSNIGEVQIHVTVLPGVRL